LDAHAPPPIPPSQLCGTIPDRVRGRLLRTRCGNAGLGRHLPKSVDLPHVQRRNGRPADWFTRRRGDAENRTAVTSGPPRLRVSHSAPPKGDDGAHAQRSRPLHDMPAAWHGRENKVTHPPAARGAAGRTSRRARWRPAALDLSTMTKIDPAFAGRSRYGNKGETCQEALRRRCRLCDGHARAARRRGRSIGDHPADRGDHAAGRRRRVRRGEGGRYPWDLSVHRSCTPKTLSSPRNSAFAPFVRPTPQSDPRRPDRARIVS
jgi:hypothetical protein